MIRIAALALLLAGPAAAHSFYSKYCCSSVDGMSGDCQEIPASAVEITPEGFRVTVSPENHVRAKTTIVRTFRYPDADPSNDEGEALLSPDGAYHACVLPKRQEFRCFYFTPGGS